MCGNIWSWPLDARVVVMLESIIEPVDGEAIIKDPNPTYSIQILVDGATVVKVVKKQH